MFFDEPREAQIQAISERLRRKPTLPETGALAAAIGFSLGFYAVSILVGRSQAGADYFHFLSTTNPDYKLNFYVQWFQFFMIPLLPLPFMVGYMIWNALNIAGTYIATRVFGGSLVMALLSYPMLFILFYGQMLGIIVAGFALYYFGLLRRNILLAGVGASLALLKVHVGIPFLLILMLMSDVSWKERIASFAVPAGLTVVTMIIWGNWPLRLLHTLLYEPPVWIGSISLWEIIGPISLLLYLPLLLLPLTRTQRLIGLAATSGLAVPYYQPTGLLLLLTLPVGAAGLLNYLGLLMLPFNWAGLEALILMPIAVYVKSILPGIQRLRRSPTLPARGESAQA